MGDTNIELAEQIHSDHQEKHEEELIQKEPEIQPDQEAPPPVSKKEIKKALKLKKKKELEEKKKKYFTNQDQLSRLERYEELDRNHKLNKKFQGNPNFKGPSVKRKRTDWIWIIVFLAFNGVLAFHGITAYSDGRIGRLTKGTDFRAELCGQGRLKGLDYLYFFQPVTDMNVRQCVSSCPNTSGTPICLYNNTYPITNTPYCYTQLQTTASGRNCLPVEPVNRNVVNNYLSTLDYEIQRIAGDISLTLDIMGVGLLICILLSALCFYLMKKDKALRYVVWAGIWATLFSCVSAAVFSYLEYKRTILERCIGDIDKYSCGGTKAEAYWWATWGFTGLGVLYICVIMKVFNRINLAIGIIKATSKLIKILSQSASVPWILMAFELGVGVWTIASGILALSIGEIVTISATNINGGKVRTIQMTSWVRLLVFFDIFMFFWWLNVILLLGDILISFSLCTWFFTRRKATVNIPTWRFFKAIFKAHLGTIIFLSLIKILFQVPKTILAMCKSLLKRGKQYSNFIKFFQASCLCCIHVYERLLRYVSKTTIVQVVIWSEPYSVAARKAYFLLFRNERKVRNMDFLQFFVVFQTKILCGFVGAIITYLVIALAPYSIIRIDLSQVESPLGSTIVVFILGFLYSSIFQGQFDIANKTLVQCYLMDEEMFVGEQRFVEDDIRKFMEYFRLQMDEAEDAKIQEGTKGLTAKIGAGDKFLAQEDDPDIEENKKLEIKEESSSSSESESSDSDSDEEEEEEVKQEEEEEQEQSQQADQSKDMTTDRHILTNNQKKTEKSEAESEEGSEEEGSEEEEEGSEEEDGSEEGSEEEESEDEPPKKNNNRTTGKIEDNSYSVRPLSGQSVNSGDIQIQNTSQRTLVRPSSGGAGNFHGDAPSIFNKSKVQNSALKIEDYDQDDEEGQYRL